MSFQGPRIARAQAGTLNLSVAYGGQRADELGVGRLWFSYRVEETIGARRGVLTGRDPGASAAGDVTARTMVGALASFLADAGDRYRTRMRAADTAYLRWLCEAAYVNSDELALLTDAPDEPTANRSPEYVSIVLKQGDVTDLDGFPAHLPASYVMAHVELGYATTTARSQGVTVDATHTLVAAGAAREDLYVAMSRGRAANHLYVATDAPGTDCLPSQQVGDGRDLTRAHAGPEACLGCGKPAR